MSNNFLGEVQIFGFNFAPSQWASCNGALLAVSQFSALYALLGTAYGGNGTTNFQLPNLTNRLPCNQGAGPGLSSRTIGETFGEQSVTVLQNQMPQHSHQMQIFTGPNTTKSASPATNATLTSPAQTELFHSAPIPNTTLFPATVTVAGGGQPHANIQPYLAINYSIALSGEFPQFN